MPTRAMPMRNVARSHSCDITTSAKSCQLRVKTLKTVEPTVLPRVQIVPMRRWCAEHPRRSVARLSPAGDLLVPAGPGARLAGVSDTEGEKLTAAQSAGYTDMAPGEFRAAAHEVADLIADYLEHVEQFAVFPAVGAGALRSLFPQAPPERPEPLAAILRDVRQLVEPNVTHWQHPGFFAYFATTASGAGMLGEFLTAALGSNAMLWRTSPVATELEQVVVDWLRQGLGL